MKRILCTCLVAGLTFQPTTAKAFGPLKRFFQPVQPSNQLPLCPPDPPEQAAAEKPQSYKPTPTIQRKPKATMPRILPPVSTLPNPSISPMETSRDLETSPRGLQKFPENGEEELISGRPVADVTRVKDKTFELNCEIRNAGQSGIAGVDVYCTRNGKEWEKVNVEIERQLPVPVTVPQEGLYGFRIIPRTGFGGGKPAPSSGEPAHVWIDVDFTKPVVRVAKAQTDNIRQTVTVNWEATDRNLGHHPVTLSYARMSEREAWTPIATNLNSQGSYAWKIPPALSGKILIRAEAADLAGNVGVSEIAEAILVDTAQPDAFNIRVNAPSRK